MPRRIELTTQFKKDFKRELKGQYRTTVEADYVKVRTLLAANAPLAARQNDHKYKHLKDVWRCHIYPDLALIYSYPDFDTLRMERIGSHSELD